MRYLLACLCAAALALGPGLAAQEAAPLASTGFSEFESGDGILSLALGTSLSLGFIDPSTWTYLPPTTDPGFAFSLSYARFLDAKWAIAGDLSGGFINTVNDRRLFVAPISLRLVRAFATGPFVIAPSVGAGVAISSLLDSKHADGLLKIGSSFLWRATSDMSYGLNMFANVIPQIYSNAPDQNRIGTFLEATLSVAYHL